MQHPRVLHLVVLAALIVVAIVTVVLLVWGGSDGDTAPRHGASTPRSTTTPRTTTVASLPPILRDPQYRFVGEPLVLFRPQESNREWDAFQRLGVERLGCVAYP